MRGSGGVEWQFHGEYERKRRKVLTGCGRYQLPIMRVRRGEGRERVSSNSTRVGSPFGAKEAECREKDS